MRVLLHADSLIRDPAPMMILAAILRKAGHKVVVSSRLTTFFYLKCWKPEYLVHSMPNAVAALYDKGALKKDETKVLNNSSRRYGNHDDTMRAFYGGILRDEIRTVISKIYFWNQHQRDWFLNTAKYPTEKLVIQGNARLDLAKFSGTKRIKNGVIGFIGRFPTINKYDGSSFIRHMFSEQNLKTELGKKNRILWFNTQISALAAYAEIIHYIMRETDYSVSIRPHHEEALWNEGFKSLVDRYGSRIGIDRGLSIYEWSLGMDVLISTTSMTFAEAYLARTPVIGIDKLAGCSDNLDADEAPILSSYEEMMLPNSFDEFKELLDKCVGDNFVMPQNKMVEEIMKQEFLWPYNGSVLNEVAKAISSDEVKYSKRKMRLPLFFGDLFYFVQLFRFCYLKRGSFYTPKLVMGKHYNRLVHGVPKYITEIVENITNNKK